MVTNLPANAGDARDVGSIPGLGRFPGVGSGNPLQHSSWRIPWTEEPEGGATAHGVPKSQTGLSTCTCTYIIIVIKHWQDNKDETSCDQNVDDIYDT